MRSNRRKLNLWLFLLSFASWLLSRNAWLETQIFAFVKHHRETWRLIKFGVALRTDKSNNFVDFQVKGIIVDDLFPRSIWQGFFTLAFELARFLYLELFLSFLKQPIKFFNCFHNHAAFPKLHCWWSLWLYYSCVDDDNLTAAAIPGNLYLPPSDKLHPQYCTSRLALWNHRCPHHKA